MFEAAGQGGAAAAARARARCLRTTYTPATRAATTTTNPTRATGSSRFVPPPTVFPLVVWPVPSTFETAGEVAVAVTEGEVVGLATTVGVGTAVITIPLTRNVVVSLIVGGCPLPASASTLYVPVIA